MPLHDRHRPELDKLQERWPESLVTTPSGRSDDAFMISFARDQLEDGSNAKIVTNDLFRDHGVSPEWVRANTEKYTFAGPNFVPGS